MSAPNAYIASKILQGESESLRQHSLTRWLSRDLMQAAADFCRNLGLIPIYAETSPDHLTRYLFWRAPQGALIEVRSGRAREKFEEIDQAKQRQGWRLLSLHINESDVYSGVWISGEHFEEGKKFLLTHGITAAERREAAAP